MSDDSDELMRDAEWFVDGLMRDAERSGKTMEDVMNDPEELGCLFDVLDCLREDDGTTNLSVLTIILSREPATEVDDDFGAGLDDDIAHAVVSVWAKTYDPEQTGRVRARALIEGR